MSTAVTKVQNLGSRRFIRSLPPNGRTLEPNQIIAFDGILDTALFLSDASQNSELALDETDSMLKVWYEFGGRVLSAVGAPVEAADVANKSYVDVAIVNGGTTKVNKSGDTMTGPLILSGAPATGLQASTKQYVDNETTRATAAEALKESLVNKGATNGYASLDGGGKVPTAQLPASVVGSLNYQGTWNANTNSPTLASSAGTKGFYYKVSVAGSTTLNGISQWSLGDIAAFNGSTWDKIDGATNEVLSVAGRTGDVVLTKTDVGLANVDNTSDVNKPVSTAQATADALKLAKASNLSDLASIPTARANLLVDQTTIPDWIAGTYRAQSVVINANVLYSALFSTSLEPSAFSVSLGHWEVLAPIKVFNGAGQLVQLDADTKLPVADGSNLTNLAIWFAMLDLIAGFGQRLLFGYGGNYISITGDGTLTPDDYGLKIDNPSGILTLHVASFSIGGILDLTGVNPATALEVTVQSNNLSEVRLPPLTSGNIVVSNNYMRGSALNQMFSDLGTTSTGTIAVNGNPGADVCDRTIATNKGWTFI